MSERSENVRTDSQPSKALHEGWQWIEAVVLQKGDAQLQVTLATNGTELEVGLIYIGYGYRALHKGEGRIKATDVFNQAMAMLVERGFTGDTEPLDPFDVAIAVAEVEDLLQAPAGLATLDAPLEHPALRSDALRLSGR